MKIALYNRIFEEEHIPFFQELFETLEKFNFSYVIFEDFKERLIPHLEISKNIVSFTHHNNIPKDVDIFISLGGDGTMLDTVNLVHNSLIPTLGINLGRLGFLADVRKEEIALAFRALKLGSYSIENRSLVHLDSNINLFGEHSYGLNEFTIHRKDTSSMIKIHTFINGDFLNTYWSDGLIVATPTGSTGYSLSCGGPIVFPTAENFIITPVAPHNLNIRPIIVPDNSIISFTIEGRNNQFLCTLDSKVATISHDVQLAVKKESFNFRLVRLDDHEFLDTLRQKLFWGADNRN
ncbi:MAG TPA: NAD kinase [Edaphocola sp.]|nr:NAD kinase [Edaphocola sp.]